MKTIKCSVHGFIQLSPIAVKVIDSCEFQRLKNIKQLGLCHFVYPSALHTRFEHSIGTYHIANLMTNAIKNYKFSIDELHAEKRVLSDGEIECIKLAGLCHDLGHGPYSHIFDDVFLNKSTHPNKTHEVRSCIITEKILQKLIGHSLSDYEVLTQNHIDLIKQIINPTNERLTLAKESNSQAIFQIVSNKFTGVDVDKFDYLNRDCNTLDLGLNFSYQRLINGIIINEIGDICYPKKREDDIYRLFYSRYDMHKNVYNHTTVKCIETMLKDILNLIDDEIELSKSIDNMEDFCNFNDHTIFEYIKFNMKKLKQTNIKLVNLYDKLCNRILYKPLMFLSSEEELNNEYDKLNELYPGYFRKVIYGISFCKDIDKVSYYGDDEHKNNVNFNSYNKYLLICIDKTIKNKLYQSD